MDLLWAWPKTQYALRSLHQHYDVSPKCEEFGEHRVRFTMGHPCITKALSLSIVHSTMGEGEATQVENACVEIDFGKPR